MKDHQRTTKGFNFTYDSVFALLYARYTASKEKDFIISLSGDAEERYTYGSFLTKAFLLRKYLAQKGIRKGECINILCQNSADFLIIYFAALSLGIVVCPINYNLAPREVRYIIKDSQGRMLFVEHDHLGKYEAIQNELPSDYGVVVLTKKPLPERYENFYSLIENDRLGEADLQAATDIALSDKAVIIYTSGTSGNPKGAILTHANLLADAQAIAEWFRFDSGTRTLCILPLFHNNGQVVTLLAPLWAGGSTVMIKGNISLKLFWALVEKYSVTWTSVIPTILSVLLNFRIERKDKTLAGIICGGALLPKSVQVEFERRYAVPIYEGYGLTETTSFSCFNPFEIDRRVIGSIGLTLPVNEMAVFDEHDDEIPNGEIGEICIRGYNVFPEYCNLPERNATVFRKGWFHSGDYGYRDDAGFFFFKGRRDDLIIKGGENIYPREIENVVYMHGKVKDCAVVGVEHKLWGENIILFIEVKENETMTKEDILNFLKGKIADYKMPAEVYFIGGIQGPSELPKGPTNKILRKELKAYYQNCIRK